MSEFILEIRNVSKQFGGLHALEGVQCTVPRGQIKAIIGPNGAGKTTLFNCLTGVFPPTSGDILFEGKSMAGLAPHQVAAAGIARTWQTIALFDHMTALENVLVGRHCRSHCGMIRSALRFPSQRKEEHEMHHDALCRLEMMGIPETAHRPIGELTFLQQRRVELARCLASEPRLLLLDEPAAGLNIKETAELGEIIRVIHRMGITVILVEHDMSLVMDISDSILVLDRGVPLAEGSPREIQSNEKVIAVYLGEDEEIDPCSVSKT